MNSIPRKCLFASQAYGEINSLPVSSCTQWDTRMRNHCYPMRWNNKFLSLQCTGYIWEKFKHYGLIRVDIYWLRTLVSLQWPPHNLESIMDNTMFRRWKYKGFQILLRMWDLKPCNSGSWSRARVRRRHVQKQNLILRLEGIELLPSCSGSACSGPHSLMTSHFCHPWGGHIPWCPDYRLNFFFPYNIMSRKHMEFLSMQRKHSQHGGTNNVHSSPKTATHSPKST